MAVRQIIINGNPVKLIPFGYCDCGCGETMHLTDKRGRLRRFIKGHEGRGSRGGSRIMSTGYEMSLKGDDHCSPKAGKTLRHIIIAEKALGKPLPQGSEIHHVNSIRADNGRGNLVICQDRAYHRLLHQRTTALNVCGHADWLKCYYCGQYDALQNMVIHYRKRRGYHRYCANKYSRDKRFERETGLQIGILNSKDRAPYRVAHGIATSQKTANGAVHDPYI